MSYRAWGHGSSRAQLYARAIGMMFGALCSASALLACQSDVQAEDAEAFCVPGGRVLGDAGLSERACECRVTGREACIVGSRPVEWSCHDDGSWVAATDASMAGACRHATDPCAEPMASLEICFGRYASCVMRVNGSVCGYTK